jgi:hypothetical protein
MISTVTSTTVSTITSSASSVTTGTLAASLALVSVVVLFVLLVQKELVTAADTSRFRALGRTLDVAVVPLLMAFAMIVVTRVAEALR